MSKFCGKCGAKNEDGALICQSCGEPLEAAPAAAAPVQKTSNHRTVGIAAVAAIAVLVLVLIINLFGGRSAEATAKKFVAASLKPDTAKVFTLIPKKVLTENHIDKKYIKSTCEDLDEDIEESLDYLKEKKGKNLKITYTVLGVVDVSSEDLKELKEDYKDYYGIKVQAAKEVSMEIKIFVKGDRDHDDYEDENTIRVPVVKIGGKWYLDYDNIGSISLVW